MRESVRVESSPGESFSSKSKSRRPTAVAQTSRADRREVAVADLPIEERAGRSGGGRPAHPRASSARCSFTKSSIGSR